MKILIIGGTKFLGYHLTRRLVRSGFEVTLFNRGITPGNFNEKVARVTGDRKNYDEFYNRFHGKRFDAVIDLIGYDLDDIEVTEKTFRGNIGQYIFISSGQVYLVTENRHIPSREEDFFQELIPCPPGEESAYSYGVEKRKIEKFLEDRFFSSGFPSVRLRCPVIHGPRDYTLRLYSYLLRISDGNPVILPEGGDIIIRHIFVQDVVRAIETILLREGFSGKVYNLAQSEILPLSEFLGKIAGILGVTVKFCFLPGDQLIRSGISMEISPFSNRWVSYMDPSLAVDELEFRSTPLEHWLPLVIEYFQNLYQGPPPENFRSRPTEIDLLRNIGLASGKSE